MTKDIVAAVLGLITLPIVGGVIATAIFAGKFIASFGLSSNHYWAGFWSMIGIVVVIGICSGLYLFVTEFRNI